MEKHEAENGIHDKLTESSYHTWATYLQAMKQFMAEITGMCQSPTKGDIEEYLRYEKEISHHIQEILEQCR
jgi:hypothetical protein